MMKKYTKFCEDENRSAAIAQNDINIFHHMLKLLCKFCHERRPRTWFSFQNAFENRCLLLIFMKSTGKCSFYSVKVTLVKV